jgi:galactose-1-phosphate uridylyltransferase
LEVVRVGKQHSFSICVLCLTNEGYRGSSPT